MQHLLLDLYQCNPDQLADADALHRFLNEMPDHIGMQKVSSDTLYYIDAVSDSRDAGHSGLILASHHVSLHAWPPYQMINIDIFSRDEFDESEAIMFVRATFAPGDLEVHSVQRATRSPRSNGGADHPVVPVVESKAPPPAVVHRCLYRGPGGCSLSTGSAHIKYCEVHRYLLLQP